MMDKQVVQLLLKRLAMLMCLLLVLLMIGKMSLLSLLLMLKLQPMLLLMSLLLKNAIRQFEIENYGACSESKQRFRLSRLR